MILFKKSQFVFQQGLTFLLVSVIALSCSDEKQKRNADKDNQSLRQKADWTTILKQNSLFLRKHASLPSPINLTYQESFISLGKGRIRIIQTGTRYAPAILLLHGATFRAELWEKLGTMELLAQKGYRVISADLPNHGKSSNPQLPPEIFLETLMDKIGLVQPTILGHSYAGAFCLPLLANNPTRIKGAILVSPTSIKKYKEKIKKPKLPVLIIWGERDELIPIGQSSVLLALFPNGKKEILKNASHECYNDQRTRFHSLLIDFLNREQPTPKKLTFRLN